MKEIEKTVLGWILANGIRNERGDALEFDEHYFLLEPFSNWHWKQVCMKSAQVGFSTLAIIKTIYAAAFRKWNVIYTLPSFEDVHDFVPSKVDGMTTNNAIIASLIKKSDAITKKQIMDSFVWFRGTHGKKAAIMHTSDLNIYDELDASDLSVIELYSSRLQKSKYKGEWKFSNPIRPGGIDQEYGKSDMRKWFIKCSRCNTQQVLEYEQNVDKGLQAYICSKCKKVLSHDDRRVGEWVAAYPGKEVHGYHISQLMAPWVTAKELIYLEENKSAQYFYNMVLGLPYIEKDDIVDRALIEGNILIKENSKLRNAMGVDVKYRELHFVIGNHEGIFKVGKCVGDNAWNDIEGIIRKYNPIVVCDANPDPYPRRVLMPKYSGRFFVCFYKHHTERRRLIEWGTMENNRGHVYVDRNQLISSLVYDLVSKKIRFTTSGISVQEYLNGELDEYLKHWENIYKITEEDRYGIPYSDWKRSGPDDFVHATGYYKMALDKVEKVEQEEIYAGSAITIVNDAMPAEKIPILAERQGGSDEWMYV